MLKFLGLGSAFNTKLGNTSAYIKEEDTLLLIDCGGMVFHKMNELNLWRGVKRFYIIITHTHPDHIGSLGDIIFYASILLNLKPVIFFPEKDLLITYLRCIGVEDERYIILDNINHTIDDTNFGLINLRFIPVSHLNTLNSYGFILSLKQKCLYYSGDANQIPDEVTNLLENNQLDFLYQDTCGLEYEGNAHLSLNKLKAMISPLNRSKVYCIHHDFALDLSEVTKSGFKVPKLNEL